MEDDQQKPKQPLIPFTPVPVRHRNDGLERSAQPVRGIITRSMSGGHASMLIEHYDCRPARTRV
jgi:hypothetical protein